MNIHKYPPPGKLVDVGGYRLHMVCQGQGSPTVVMDSGFGGFASDWSLVQPEIAKFTQVCAYDRSGYAWSEPNPKETVRTSLQLVHELHSLLEKESILGPYVLVGHSFGSLNVRVFADQYPDEVVGMVLLDPAHEDAEARLNVSNHSIVSRLNFQANLLRIGVVRKWLAPRMMVSMIPEYKNLPPDVWAMHVAVALNSENLRTAAQEAAAATESMAQVRATHGLGDIPLVVMMSKAMSTAFPSSWMVLAKEMAGLSTQGRHVLVEGTGHYIQLGRPDAVIDAVRQVVETAHGRQQTS